MIFRKDYSVSQKGTKHVFVRRKQSEYSVEGRKLREANFLLRRFQNKHVCTYKEFVSASPCGDASQLSGDSIHMQT
jgi:hypothetical protein